MTTAEMLAESVDQALIRERAFASLKGPWVLFGAGTVGRKIAAALLRRGDGPVAFADNDVKLVGSLIKGVKIHSLSEAVNRWKDDAVFVVTILHPADQGMAARIRYLKQLGCREVYSFLSLGWILEGVLPHFGADLPSRLLRESSSLQRVADMWTDSASRETYRQQLSWRLRDDFSSLNNPAPYQYFPRDLIRPDNAEAFVDGGAYDGDTLRAIPWKLSRAWAIEPDPMNITKLRKYEFKGLEIYPFALGKKPGRLRFHASGTMASAISESGLVEVDVMTLDQLLENSRATFIKLDIEGAELDALQGAKKVLLRDQPVMAVCIYHLPEDLWTIPLFLKESFPEHGFFLRAHAHDGFELVVYAIPPQRMLG